MLPVLSPAHVCINRNSSVAAKLQGSAQGNCSLDIFGNVEVSTHNEIQNQAASAGYCEFLYSVAVAKTTEVCADKEGMD